MKTPNALIIEDDEKLAVIFSKAFETANFSVTIAWDGNAAIKQLKTLTPDVVVLDLHLPYVSGIDILRQIRADVRLAKCRVVVVTADLFKAESVKADADLVLIKPISFNQLRNLANQLYTSGFN